MSDEFQIVQSVVSAVVPWAQVGVTVVIGRISLKFAKDQAAIAKTQADTAIIQAKTARNKLKFDLLEKRMAIYNATAKLLSKIATAGNSTGPDQFEFYNSVDSAKWLFSDAVHKYVIEEIYKKAVQLQASVETMDGMAVGPQRTKLVEEQRAIKEHLVAQRMVIDEMMDPFLRLEDC